MKTVPLTTGQRKLKQKSQTLFSLILHSSLGSLTESCIDTKQFVLKII